MSNYLLNTNCLLNYYHITYFHNIPAMLITCLENSNKNFLLLHSQPYYCDDYDYHFRSCIFLL